LLVVGGSVVLLDWRRGWRWGRSHFFRVCLWVGGLLAVSGLLVCLTLWLWNRNDVGPTPWARLRSPPRHVQCVALATDGKTLAWGTSGGRVRLADLGAHPSPSSTTWPTCLARARERAGVENGMFVLVFFIVGLGVSPCYFGAVRTLDGRGEGTAGNGSPLQGNYDHSAIALVLAVFGIPLLLGLEVIWPGHLPWAEYRPLLAVTGGLVGLLFALGLLLFFFKRSHQLRWSDVLRPAGRIPAQKVQVLSASGLLLAVCLVICGCQWLTSLDEDRFEESTQLRGHCHPVWALAFSPDGKTLASSSSREFGFEERAREYGVAEGAAENDSAVRLWDLGADEPRERTVGPEHKIAVSAVAFAPDGRTLATGGADHSVRLWDVGGAKPAERLVSREGGSLMSGIQFTRDGKTL